MRIVYVSWPVTEITGGIKSLLRHVEFLREAGIEAVVAAPGGRPPGWLATNTPLLDTAALAPGDDVLVFPENHFQMLQAFAAWPNRKLVFCQGRDKGDAYIDECGRLG
jgi:hypothetical protein